MFVSVPEFENGDGDVDFYLKATANLILKADCSWRPWVIALSFITTGLSLGCLKDNFMIRFFQRPLDSALLNNNNNNSMQTHYIKYSLVN